MPFSAKGHPLGEAKNLKRALHAAGVALWFVDRRKRRFRDG